MSKESIYPQILNILRVLLEESGNRHWSNWIERDISEWNESRKVQHHLSAFGGMGSINDLFVAEYDDEVGIWKQEIFERCKSLSWKLAIKGGIGSAGQVDLSLNEDKTLSGARCLDCGNSRLSKVDIEYYIANKFVPDFIVQKINDCKISDILNIDEIINQKLVAELRKKITLSVEESEIDLVNSDSWIKSCPKCKSNNMAVYRWEIVNSVKEFKIIPSEDNLKIKVEGEGFFDRIKRILNG